MGSGRSIVKKLLILVLTVLGLVQAAAAIPSFSRKYGYSCQVCHDPIPHLNAVGEKFMKDGFMISGKEKPQGEVDTGDPLLSLPQSIPLSFRIDSFLAYSPNGTTKADFHTPSAVKFISGGNISDSISYYTYFLMTEDAKIVGLEDSFLNFRHIFGLPVDVLFGQFRLTDPVALAESRLTFEEYAIYGFSVGQSRINLAYERGLQFSGGTKSGTDFVLSLVNGNGIEGQEIFDSDKYKCVLGRVAQSFAKDSLRIGVLAYGGKEAGPEGGINSVFYFGPDVRLRLPGVDLMAEYVHRSDTNPLFAPIAQKIGSDAFLAEATIRPWTGDGRTFFTLAWNRVQSDFEEARYSTLTVNVNHLLRRNLVLIAEYTHDLLGNDHRFLAGIVTSF
jgi:hypothetical protein